MCIICSRVHDLQPCFDFYHAISMFICKVETGTAGTTCTCCGVDGCSPTWVSLRRHQCPSQWAKAGGRWAGESMALIDFHGAWEKWFSSWNIFCPWSFCWNMNAVVFFEWGIYFGETLYYNHARLHRILQKSILQLNWKKKSHRIFGFWGEVFFVWKLRSVRMFFQLLLLSIDFHLSQGRVRQQLARGNKRQNKEKLFQLLFIMQNLSKNQFLGVRKNPPHAGIVKPQYSMYVAFTCFWYHCMWQYHWATNT